MKPRLVLHVEDSRVCRELLAARLNRAPCLVEVVEASTIAEARVALGSHAVAVWALVVLDLDLAGESSTVLLPLLRGIPTVFVTATPESVPKGFPVVKKGRGWIPAIERMLLG